ncbi:LOW QUALITY PROTEIN: FERM and PDZ domain-containing protein 2 [Glossophaga mutica]
MSPASVTVASALKARGEALSEEKIWSLLSLGAKQLLEHVCEGSSNYVVSWSTLLSVFGSLSFQGHIYHTEAAAFKTPELLQRQKNSKQPDASRMHMYSLGITLYWSAGFHVPPNQPQQLQEPLHSLLLTMCKEQPGRWLPLQLVLEACWVHQEEGAIYPALASVYVRGLVGLLLGTVLALGPLPFDISCLAGASGKEFFFLANETSLCKIAPKVSKQPQRTSWSAFILFLRIKFFVSHSGLLQSWTRHHFPLQLRKDILEEKLYCNDEMLLQLGVLALQAEFGSYPEEQVETKAYFHIEDYIPASLIEKMTALRVQDQVSEMHCLSPVLGEEAELKFLKVTQQLLEYGVLVYKFFQRRQCLKEKWPWGICAQGLIIYEENNSRIATLRFQWREIGKILTYVSKFTITISITKKHTFVTDSAKTCKGVLSLCSAQYGCNAQMNDYSKCVQMANLSLAHLAQSKPLTWIQRLSCSESMLFTPRLEDPVGGLLCFVIKDGEDVGKVDSGIFISSIVPGGQAEKAKKIKSEQILALNHVSLESFTFDMAVRMIQNSPDYVELIISQSKGIGNTLSEEKNSTANSGVISTDSLSSGHQGRFSSHMQDQERNTEELKVARAQSLLVAYVSLQRPVAKPPRHLRWVLQQGAGSSCSASLSETNAVELIKEDGILGFSITGGINTGVPYGGIYVKIIAGGPSAKERQILQGDRLLKVDGMSLCGLTHKQAVLYLKGSRQVARLVLERRALRTAQQCPSVNNGMIVECTAVSLATALPGKPASCVSATDRERRENCPQFEIKLKKNASDLGFSFVQRESCSHLKNDLVRIKWLFPGQPAEENGTIATGDIILAMNGKPTKEGLVFQEVLHLLRGASPEVMLLHCQPPPGVLPEMEQGYISFNRHLFQTKNLPRQHSEQSPSLDQENSWRESASLEVGEGLGLRPEFWQQATREAQWDQDMRKPWGTSLIHPGNSNPHLCRQQQEVEAEALPASLKKDMRQNCYSVCDIRRLGKDQKGDDSNMEDMNFWKTSSQRKTPRSVTNEVNLEKVDLY